MSKVENRERYSMGRFEFEYGQPEEVVTSSWKHSVLCVSHLPVHPRALSTKDALTQGAFS